jgi:GDP-L-fucose synthase
MASDLSNTTAVRAFFARQHIDVVVLAAARVGGIHANNTYPADFILDNLPMKCKVIGAAHAAAPVVHRTGSRID